MAYILSPKCIFSVIAGAVIFILLVFGILISTRDSDTPVFLPSSGLRQWDQIDNAGSDGWNTEVFSGLANKQLGRLGTLLKTGKKVSEDQVAPLITEEFTCSELLPENLVTVFEDEFFSVKRFLQESRGEDGESIYENLLKGTTANRNASGLASAIQRLSLSFAEAQETRFKSKVFQVTRTDEEYLTRQYIAISGRLPDGMLEQNATWIARWKVPDDGGPPRLTHLAVEQLEQIKSIGGPMFSDCTESVLGGNESYRSQLLYGVDHWMARSQNFLPHATFGRAGIAVGDVNGDGLDDLYVCQDKGLPNRLYVQQPNGTALDVSQASGADWLESSHGAVLNDLDGDGDQDLAIALLGAVTVAENDGSGYFEIRTVVPVSDDTMSISAADFDNDADLDLYVCAYKANTITREGEEGIVVASGSEPFVYYDANNGGANALLRNDGNWKFVDCTAEVGLDQNNKRISYAASWEDYDNDGDPDLYVANDFGRNNLYRNSHGRFTDVAAEAGVEDSASGMSVSWADYDRDGTMDIYIANMFSGAGNRIVAQEQFKPEISTEKRDLFLRFARGNTLLKNLGTGIFEDVSVDAGVTLGRWAWSSNFTDLNNDGWEDLVVANGYYTSELPETGDL